MKVENMLKECDKLVEIELELESKYNLQAINYNEDKLTINIINSSIVSQGHAIIGTGFGSNTNLPIIYHQSDRKTNDKTENLTISFSDLEIGKTRESELTESCEETEELILVTPTVN